MKAAIAQAKKAEAIEEVPVGAVIVYDGKIVARAHNKRNTKKDGTAHAEILAIAKAGKKLNRWNLSDCEMYVTLEPCAMCAGAAVNSRIKRIIFGAYDKRFGCCGSIMDITNSELNHKVEIVGGIMEEQCRVMLSSFFKKLRERAKNCSKQIDINE
ncbi:MAG: tRNA adenosine(34) deaminase TadA [Clostridia bacterium]|nr:tRNA adenosine(34) deaminase TadA [Clostridia bacterium]